MGEVHGLFKFQTISRQVEQIFFFHQSGGNHFLLHFGIACSGSCLSEGKWIPCTRTQIMEELDWGFTRKKNNAIGTMEKFFNG